MDMLNLPGQWAAGKAPLVFRILCELPQVTVIFAATRVDHDSDDAVCQATARISHDYRQLPHGRAKRRTGASLLWSKAGSYRYQSSFGKHYGCQGDCCGAQSAYLVKIVSCASGERDVCDAARCPSRGCCQLDPSSALRCIGALLLVSRISRSRASFAGLQFLSRAIVARCKRMSRADFAW